jgi:predicted metal-dependent phosphoesterase TrpH
VAAVTLAPDAAIDLQLHTTYSDGAWSAGELLDYVAGEGFARFDEPGLDRFRAAVPIDGLEVYHPSHTPGAAAMYLDYANHHSLLVSTGSNSHGKPDQMPIKYRAEISRKLLERLGITVG